MESTTRAKLSDLGQIILLLSLTLNAFGWPIYQEYDVVEPIFELMMTAVIASSLLIVMSNRVVLYLLLMLGSVIILSDFVSNDASPVLERVANAASLLFSLVLGGTLLSQLFSNARAVDWRTIANAVTVYLLIGLGFASLFQLLGVYGAIGGDVLPFLDQGPDGQELAALYFSFVTLTTVGYGDLVPTTSSFASLAMFEAVIGQLYLAIVVARLVGLHVSRDM